MIKKIKLTKEMCLLLLIMILSIILNFTNLSIEGTANSYYAAAAKSMTLSLKNFFFVAFDPAGFVTIDKPPLGFWLQAISAKVFGFSGWSIILPQALAGVISVALIYIIVKRSFGSAAGLISALCLAITPVFVAVSRNNTVDNVLVMTLLFACWALSIAAEKGKFKYLMLSMVLVGVGFNVKMLQAYMIAPALYITYLLSSAVSLKKRIVHLALSTVILVAVSLSWALVVDSIPAKNRPYIDSSTNNTVMELITGHNGLERISLGSSSNNGGGAPGGNGQPTMQQGKNEDSSEGTTQEQSSNSQDQSQKRSNQGFNGGPSGGNSQGMPGNPPSGDGQRGMGPGGPGGGAGGPGGGLFGLAGSFGGQLKASITRLFSKNILSDQIVWFIPLAVFGFIAAAIKEKLGFKLDNKRKQSLVLWFMWFLPEFIYFSYNTGLFHSYYLTMLAPPIAALAGIGIASMWELYKEGGWKSWFLPISLIANGAVQFLMLSYFVSSSNVVKVLMVLVIALCFIPAVILSIANIIRNKESLKLKKILVGIALTGILVTPFVGSSTVMFYSVNGSFPAAGLELLSGNGNQQSMPKMDNASGNSDSKLIEFLQKNKTSTQKYLLVVATSSDGADIIIKTGEPVMSLGGFMGNNKAITLDEFKEMAKKGEIRYVKAGGRGGSSNNEIMNWVQQNGKLVSISGDNNSTVSSSENSSSTNKQNHDGFGGGNSDQLYDLKAYTDSQAK